MRILYCLPFEHALELAVIRIFFNHSYISCGISFYANIEIQIDKIQVTKQIGDLLLVFILYTDIWM